jgi:ribose 5-phosphate isomerase B
MRITIGSDHRGVQVKARLIQTLTGQGHQVTDAGAHEGQAVDYPDVASVVARAVAAGASDRGILICGTGIGMSIAANKVPQVRAATCYDEVTAEMCRRHNDVNVLCLSGDMLGEKRMDRLVEIWLTTEFEGGRHARRLEKIAGLEHEFGTGPAAAEA